MKKKSVNGKELNFEAKLWQAADKMRNNMDADLSISPQIRQKAIKAMTGTRRVGKELSLICLINLLLICLA